MIRSIRMANGRIELWEDNALVVSLDDSWRSLLLMAAKHGFPKMPDFPAWPAWPEWPLDRAGMPGNVEKPASGTLNWFAAWVTALPLDVVLTGVMMFLLGGAFAIILQPAVWREIFR